MSAQDAGKAPVCWALGCCCQVSAFPFFHFFFLLYFSVLRAVLAGAAESVRTAGEISFWLPCKVLQSTATRRDLKADTQEQGRPSQGISRATSLPCRAVNRSGSCLCKWSAVQAGTAPRRVPFAACRRFQTGGAPLV